ncbi:MAG: RbcX chaperonin protein [Cyanobacteria bacterium J083]|nr:MAG: RbcX chaperonin protein [Cyanobacteria bacterium J083]
MQLKKIRKDTVKVLISYLTYQAVKIIIEQLKETNPLEAIWLSNYATKDKLQDDKIFLEGLMLERKDLVLRILIVRQHIAQEVVEFLPSMVLSQVDQSNLEQRRHLLERLTKTETALPEAETDNNESSD